MIDDRMNIRSARGTRVVFDADGGRAGDAEHAIQSGLERGKVYTVKYTRIDGFSTDVRLVEVPGKLFNSCLFAGLE